MTYLYETIPANEGDPVQQFEIKQGMNAMPLTRHPETGEPIRRVILGGWGLTTSKISSNQPAKGSCGCGPGGCC